MRISCVSLWLEMVSLHPPDAVHSLELKLAEVLLDSPTTPTEKTQHEQQAVYITKLVSLIREQADVTMDEMHLVLRHKDKLNYTIGKPKPLQKFLINNCVYLFEFFDKNFPDILNKSDENAAATFADILQQLARLLVQDPTSPLYTTIFAVDSLGSSDKTALIEYLQNKGEQIPDFVKGLTLEQKDRLAVYKALIGQFLPYTLQRRHGLHYGPSLRGELDALTRALAIPYFGSNKPREGSQFGDNIEKIVYTVLSLRKSGLTYELMHFVLKQYIEQAAIEQEKKRLTSIQDTSIAGGFRDITGIELGQIDLENTIQIGSITAQIGHNSAFIFDALRRHILPQIRVAPRVLSGDQAGRVDTTHSCHGFTGTPLTHTTFHSRLGYDPRPALGSAGHIMSVLRTKNTVIQQLDFTNLPEFFAALFPVPADGDRAPEVRAIIDISARFRGIENVAVASALAEFIAKHPQQFHDVQYVLFFNHMDKLCALRVRDPEIPIEIGPTAPENISAILHCTPEQRFTLYSQPQTTGIDVRQSDNAIGIALLDATVNIDDAFQGIMRMRGFLEGQQKVRIVVPSSTTNNLTELHDLMTTHQSQQITKENYPAILSKLRNFVRNDFMQRLLAAVSMGVAEQQRLMQAFQHYFIEEQSPSPFDLYGELDVMRPTAELLRERQRDLLGDWARILTGLNLPPTRDRQTALYNAMKGIVDKALQNKICDDLAPGRMRNNTDRAVDTEQQQEQELAEAYLHMAEREKRRKLQLTGQSDADRAVETEQQREQELAEEHQHVAESIKERKSQLAEHVPIDEEKFSNFIADYNHRLVLIAYSGTRYSDNYQPLQLVYKALGDPKILDLNQNIWVSPNFACSYRYQFTYDPAYEKPVHALRFRQKADGTLDCLLLSPQEAREYYLWIKCNPHSGIWLTTTQHTVLCGTPPADIRNSLTYQEIIDQIRFINGEFRLLVKDKATRPMPWLSRNTNAKLAFFKDHWGKFRETPAAEFTRLRETFSRLPAVFEHLAKYARLPSQTTSWVNIFVEDDFEDEDRRAIADIESILQQAQEHWRDDRWSTGDIAQLHLQAVDIVNKFIADLAALRALVNAIAQNPRLDLAQTIYSATIKCFTAIDLVTAPESRLAALKALRTLPWLQDPEEILIAIILDPKTTPNELRVIINDQAMTINLVSALLARIDVVQDVFDSLLTKSSAFMNDELFALFIQRAMTEMQLNTLLQNSYYTASARHFDGFVDRAQGIPIIYCFLLLSPKTSSSQLCRLIQLHSYTDDELTTLLQLRISNEYADVLKAILDRSVLSVAVLTAIVKHASFAERHMPQLIELAGENAELLLQVIDHPLIGQETLATIITTKRMTVSLVHAVLDKLADDSNQFTTLLRKAQTDGCLDDALFQTFIAKATSNDQLRMLLAHEYYKTELFFDALYAKAKTLPNPAATWSALLLSLKTNATQICQLLSENEFSDAELIQVLVQRTDSAILTAILAKPATRSVTVLRKVIDHISFAAEHMSRLIALADEDEGLLLKVIRHRFTEESTLADIIKTKRMTAPLVAAILARLTIDSTQFTVLLNKAQAGGFLDVPLLKEFIACATSRSQLIALLNHESYQADALFDSFYEKAKRTHGVYVILSALLHSPKTNATRVCQLIRDEVLNDEELIRVSTERTDPAILTEILKKSAQSVAVLTAVMRNMEQQHMPRLLELAYTHNNEDLLIAIVQHHVADTATFTTMIIRQPNTERLVLTLVSKLPRISRDAFQQLLSNVYVLQNKGLFHERILRASTSQQIILLMQHQYYDRAAQEMTDIVAVARGKNDVRLWQQLLKLPQGKISVDKLQQLLGAHPYSDDALNDVLRARQDIPPDGLTAILVRCSAVNQNMLETIMAHPGLRREPHMPHVIELLADNVSFTNEMLVLHPCVGQHELLLLLRAARQKIMFVARLLNLSVSFAEPLMQAMLTYIIANPSKETISLFIEKAANSQALVTLLQHDKYQPHFTELFDELCTKAQTFDHPSEVLTGILASPRFTAVNMPRLLALANNDATLLLQIMQHDAADQQTLLTILGQLSDSEPLITAILAKLTSIQGDVLTNVMRQPGFNAIQHMPRLLALANGDQALLQRIVQHERTTPEALAIIINSTANMSVEVVQAILGKLLPEHDDLFTTLLARANSVMNRYLFAQFIDTAATDRQCLSLLQHDLYQPTQLHCAELFTKASELAAPEAQSKRALLLNPQTTESQCMRLLCDNRCSPALLAEFAASPREKPDEVKLALLLKGIPVAEALPVVARRLIAATNGRLLALPRAELTGRQQFARALDILKNQTYNMVIKSPNNAKYRRAAEVSFKLHTTLDQLAQDYFVHARPTQAIQDQFAAACRAAVAEASPILSQHRGYKQVLADILNVVLNVVTLGLLRPIRGRWRFFEPDTESMRCVKDVQAALERLTAVPGAMPGAME